MRRFLGASTEAALIVTLVFGLMAAPAIAGRGGGTPSPSASMTVNPDPASAYGAEYVVTGTGFKANTAVNIVISMPSCCAFFTVTADAAGGFWFRYQTGDPGTYKIDANQRLNGKRLTLVGSTTFEVVAP